MKLVLQSGHSIIGCTALDGKRFGDKTYIQEKIFELEEAFAEQLSASFKAPVFYIEGVPSKMNKAVENSFNKKEMIAHRR
jgi:hypothetical protein